MVSHDTIDIPTPVVDETARASAPDATQGVRSDAAAHELALLRLLLACSEALAAPVVGTRRDAALADG